MQTVAKSTFGSILLLVGLSLGTLFFRLGSLPLSGSDEPRYARIAQEMHDRGSWVTPTLQDTPWLEKPPLYYWLTGPFYSLFETNETAARFGPALSALITALAIFWLGTTLRDRAAGLLAALILSTSLGFIGYGRSASTDMPFTCCLTLGLAILASAVKKDPGALKVLAAYIFLGLAVLGKGPVAIILAIGIGLLFWYLNEHGKILSRWRIAAGVPVLLLVSVPWFWLVFNQNGYSFITTFFVNQNIARYITEIHHHSQPFYYYIPALAALFFPWSGWLPFLFIKSPMQGLRNWRNWNPVMLFLTCWFIFPLLFFSLSDSKLAGYILPSLPPLSLILGLRISVWMENRVRPSTLRTSMVFNLAFSLTMAVAAPICFEVFYGGNWKTGLMLSPVLLLPACLAAVFGFRGHCGKSIQATLLHGFLIVIAATQFAFPVLADYLSTKSLAQISLNVRKAEEPIITFGYTDHTLHYYTGYQVMGKVENPLALLKFSEEYQNLLIVTKEKKIREFNFLEGFSFEILGEQGNFRLLRMSRK
ncbi:MAG: glycosyltransferase family 39 protein [Acidobacteriota bacterium]